MSDPPDKKHPWAKYYRERGVARPPVADFVRRAPPKPVEPKKPAALREEKKAAILSAELADAVAAVTAVTPGLTAAPFITAMQKEAVARELRRRARLRVARAAVIVVAGMLALHYSVTEIVYRTPTETALARHVRDLPAEVVRLYSSVEQPLQAGDVTVVETDRVSSRRIRYVALVTLVLRKPLYVPAVTNGTAAYRQLQESLQMARERDLKFNLFKPGQGPPPLPLLVQVSHRVGETLIVRVPFQAKRFTWPWRMEPPVLGLRSVSRTLTGDSLERYAESPYLIFGAPGTAAEIRRRMKQARDYIMAVAKEVQQQADVEAVAEVPAPDPAMAAPADGAEPTDRAAAPDGAGPAEPALPEDAAPPVIDPDAPAIRLPPGLSPPGKKKSGS